MSSTKEGGGQVFIAKSSALRVLRFITIVLLQRQVLQYITLVYRDLLQL